MKSLAEKNKSQCQQEIIAFIDKLSIGITKNRFFAFTVKLHLMEKFKAVPEKVILLAMDSVDYDEERAAHILEIMVAEEAIKPLHSSSSQR